MEVSGSGKHTSLPIKVLIIGIKSFIGQAFVVFLPSMSFLLYMGRREMPQHLTE